MKKRTLYYVRHSIKNAAEGTDKSLLSQEGVAAAYEAGKTFGQQIDHVFVGGLQRTAHSALAFILGYAQAGSMSAKTHAVVDQIGGDKLFAEWKANGAAFTPGVPNIDGLRKMPEQDFTAACNYALDGVKAMMQMMEDGEEGVAFGHSPVIEAAAEAAGQDMKSFQLAENCYIIFIMDDDGKIAVEMS